VRLLIQPGDGIRPLVKGISSAQKTVEIVIFRFDQKEIEQALANAVSRGVAVTALIASANSAGERNLRELESRLLGVGVTVARTHDDLVRYHGKMMIVDRHELYVLAFNFTHIDIDDCRSFGLITRSRELVQEAVRLFEADTKRIPYEPVNNRLVVSPVNARKQLEEFIRGAEKSLVIYDLQVSDHAMVRLIAERVKAGVDVRILGRIPTKVPGVKVHKLPHMRMHTRTMVRDGGLAFIGSQSLREAELDSRREIGVIFQDAKAVNLLLRTFEDDWAQAELHAQEESEPKAALKVAKKVAKAVTKEMPAVAPIVSGAVAAAAGEFGGVDVIPDEVEDVVKEAVREAVKEAVRDALEGALEADESAK
jgi:cardiolipin synthase A/B